MFGIGQRTAWRWRGRGGACMYARCGPGFRSQSTQCFRVTAGEPNGALVINDPVSLPGHMVSHRSRKLGRFSKYILEEDYKNAWQVFQEEIAHNSYALAEVDRRHCSKFLSLLPNKAFDAVQYVPWALEFKAAMQRAGMELSTMDYTFLIKLACRGREYGAIEELWSEMDSKQIAPDTDLWNAYIAGTCQAYPVYWPDGPGFKAWQRVPRDQLPPLTNDVMEVLQRMEVLGVVANARTFELVLLALARQKRTDVCRQLISRVWLGDTPVEKLSSVLWPTSSTLTAVVDAFSFNDKVEEAMEYIDQFQSRYKLRLDGSSYQVMWARLLQWLQVSTEPRGRHPTQRYFEVWDAMAQKYNVQPNLGLWRTKVVYMLWKNQFDMMEKDVSAILAVPNEYAAKTAASTLKKVIKGYANTGRAPHAVGLLESWAKMGIDLRLELQEYIKERGGGVSLDQLRMFEDDDDEDNYLGIT